MMDNKEKRKWLNLVQEVEAENLLLKEHLRRMIELCPPKRGEWLNEQAFSDFKRQYEEAKKAIGI